MFLPHKAIDADLDIIKFPIIISCKIDGVRGCFLNAEFTSRTLKPFRNQNLNNKFNNPILRGFDGELAVGSPTMQNLCRKTTSYVNSFSENTSNIVPDWYIFDYLDDNLKNVGYSERLAVAQNKIRQIKIDFPGQFDFLKPLPKIAVCKDLKELLENHKQFIEMGFEGTVIRFHAGLHKNGRSTKKGDYLRLKDNGTEEATILSIIEAEENLNPKEINNLGLSERSSHKENKISKGMVGALVVEIPDKRIITISAGKMTHEERITYWEEPNKIIGRICTYKFLKTGEHKSRRHARFIEFRDENI